MKVLIKASLFSCLQRGGRIELPSKRCVTGEQVAVSMRPSLLYLAAKRVGRDSGVEAHSTVLPARTVSVSVPPG